MRYLLFQHEFHQLLCRRGHILEPLSERHDREPHAFEVLHHLHCAPSVKRYLADMVFLAQPLDELFDVAVMHHVALGRFQIPLPLPQIVGNVVAVYAQRDVLFGYPEIR